MSYQPFLVADFQTGLFDAREPWLAPADAFPTLTNGQVFRGKLTKRSGYVEYGKLAERIETVSAVNTGTDTVTTSGAHGLSVGDYIQVTDTTGTSLTLEGHIGFVKTVPSGTTFTMEAIGSNSTFDIAGTYTSGGNVERIQNYTKIGDISSISVATSGLVEITVTSHGLSDGDTVQVLELSGGMDELNQTIDTVTVTGTNTFTLDNVDARSYSSYSSTGKIAKISANNHVVGLGESNLDGSASQLLALDVKRLYKWDVGNELFQDVSGSDTFTGDESNLFQITSWKGIAYMTNNNDRPYYYDDATPTFAVMNMDIDGDTSNEVTRVKFLFPFAGRLVALSTTEDGTAYPQRARWTALATGWSGTIATGATAWDEAVGGGFIDADTGEDIVSFAFAKDRVVVAFEDSIWTLVDTGDVELPLRWERIDEDQLIDARMGSISWRQTGLFFGTSGITAADNFTVQPFDARIPNVVDDFDGTAQSNVFAGHNREARQIWWLYPSAGNSIPDKSLIYNTEDRSFSKYELNFMVMAQFSSSQDSTWSSILDTWEQLDRPWFSFATQAQNPIVLAGDKYGFVHQLNRGGTDNGIPIEFDAFSAGINPFKEQGKQARIGYIDILFDVDADDEIEVEFYVDFEATARKTQTVSFSSDLASPDKKWVRVYANVVGNTHRIRFKNAGVNNNITIHAVELWARPEGRIIL